MLNVKDSQESSTPQELLVANIMMMMMIYARTLYKALC